MAAEGRKAESRTSGGRGVWQKILLLFISLVFALVASEIALRILGRDAPAPWPVLPSSPEIYVTDPDVGYHLEPLTAKVHRYPRLKAGRDLTLRANASGFREARPFDEADDRTRICVLGDSFVFGQGVEAGERFTNVIEARQPDWRLDNLGMNGYGPGMMVRALDKFGPVIKPDLVLLCLYSDDLRRHYPYNAGEGFLLPRFDLIEGELKSIPYPEPRFLDRFALMTRVRRTLWNRRKGDVLAAILDRTKEVSRNLGAPLAVVFLPARQDIAVHRERIQWLENWTSKAGVPFLDLSEAVHSQVGAFIPRDQHYSPAGHAAVAEHLAPFITATLAP